MTTDTLFTLRMAPAQSAEHARELAAQGGLTNGALELRVVPVDADGQVTAVASPEEATRVMIDLRVLPAQADGHATPGTGPEPPSKVVQICPGVMLRMPLDDQDVQGFMYDSDPNEWGGGYGAPFPLVGNGYLFAQPSSFTAWDTEGKPRPLTQGPGH